MIYDGQLNELWQSSSRQSNSLIQYSPSIALANIVEQYFLVDNSQYLDIPAYILPDLSAHLLIHEIQDVSGIYFRFSLVGSRSKGFLLIAEIGKGLSLSVSLQVFYVKCWPFQLKL